MCMYKYEWICIQMCITIHITSLFSLSLSLSMLTFDSSALIFVLVHCLLPVCIDHQRVCLGWVALSISPSSRNKFLKKVVKSRNQDYNRYYFGYTRTVLQAKTAKLFRRGQKSNSIFLFIGQHWGLKLVAHPFRITSEVKLNKVGHTHPNYLPFCFGRYFCFFKLLNVFWIFWPISSLILRVRSSDLIYINFGDLSNISYSESP